MRSRLLIAISFVSLAASAAAAERPRGTYIQQELETADPAVMRSHGANLIVFMNRNGGTYYSAFNNDSRQNQSSIINNTINMPPFAYGEDVWQGVMDCMRQQFADFNVEVTDVDPSPAPHIECITSGSPGDAGMGQGVGGVAPFSCGFIPNAIVFDFVEVWGPDVRGICETAAQEIAHAFGLDHEHYCPDNMTYLFGCGDKWYRDYDAPCGEYNNRACQCGGSTQNSYQEILAMFGPRPSVPPSVSITSPADGSTVNVGFAITAEATDDIAIDRVEFWIDGAMATSDSTPPYQLATFALDPPVGEGQHSIVARAVDSQELITDSAPVTVNVVGPCSGNGDCPDNQVCDPSGVCVPGPGAGNGLDDPCAANEDCASNVCVTINGENKCSQVCDPAASNCPDGFNCESGYCIKSQSFDDGKGGCGCRVGGRSASLPLVWLAFGLVGVALAIARRRA